MILSLSPTFYNSDGFMYILRGLGDDFQELRLADMMRTGASDQDPAGLQHFQGAKIQFFISAQRGIECSLALSERRRVQNDGVVLSSAGRIIFEQVEGIRFDPFDLPAIECGVAVGLLQRGAGTIHPGDVGAMRS